MQTKIPLLAALTIMSTLFAIPFAANNAHAVPGLSVLDPANTWAPYGPYQVGANTLQHVVLKYYTGDAAEYAAFQAGGSNGLDVADDGTSGNGPPATQWPVYDNTCGTCTPTSKGIDWNFTLVQGSANWQGLYFNGASSTWVNWNCNWNFYNSACGQEMRQAFAHLINRGGFVTANDAGGAGAAPIWDDAPANKVLSTCFSPTVLPCDGTPAPSSPSNDCPLGVLPTIDSKACTFSSPQANFCLWDTVSNVGCTSTTGPYLVGTSGSTTGFPGIPAAPVAGCPSGTTVPAFTDAAVRAAWASCNDDFALAAIHMNLAGVTNGMDANYQAGAHIFAGVAGHHLRACVRSSEPRRTMGLGWTAALKLLLGSGGNPNTNSVDVQLGNIIVCGFNKAFTEPPTSPIDDWDMYTYGYAASGPFPDFLYTQFDTKFSFSPGGCGGTASFTADEPNNPTFTCIDGRGVLGDADTALLSAVSSTADETIFDHKLALDANSAMNLLGKDVASIPVHTQNVRVPALRSVSGLVNTKGLGYASIAILNYAHKGTYVPVNSQFQFNNGGPSDTLRWGQAQPISFLSPYQASTVWEFNSIGQIYDTVVTANPVRPQEVFCEMCQGAIVPGTVTCGIPAVNNCTTFTMQLRQNLRFQDGTQVTAKDVAFSYLTERDQSTVLAGNFGLLDHVSLNPNNPLEVTVTMLGQSVGHLVNLSGGAVLPMARWACPASGKSADGSACDPAHYDVGLGAGNNLPEADHFKAGPGYDPVLDTNLIGSGLLACISDSGVVGTGCAKDSNGNPTGQAIDPGGSLRLTVYDLTASLGDPFAQYTRLNNPAWGSSVLRSGQQQELLYADKGQNNQVTISDLTSANLCFGKIAQGILDATHCADYNYWLRSALHTGTPSTISTETAVVASHYHDGGVLPFSWSAGSCPLPSGPDVGTAGTLTNVIGYTCH